MSSFNPKQCYLVAYNAILCIGWFAILTGIAVEFAAQGGGNLGQDSLLELLYLRVEKLLKICQTAAVLEVIHCIIKIVPSSPVLTGFQVASRLFVLWMVTDLVPATPKAPGVILFLLCWSITEVIRYAYYVLNIFGQVPYALLWCRYTFFFVLYPFGVTGELITIVKALPVVKDQGLLSVSLPNAVNFSFSYFHFLIFVMLCYIPIFPQLYFHMIAQRKKFIGSVAKKVE